MTTTNDIRDAATAVTAVVAAITALVKMGQVAWPQILGLVETLKTLIGGAMNGVEPTADELAAIRARVDAVHAANMRLDADKFGINDDAATQAANGEG